MAWKKMQLGEVLMNRECRYKPNDKAIANLKRIDKINFSGQIFLSDKSSNTDMILIKKGDLVISGINVEKGAIAVYEGNEDIIATIHYSSYKFNTSKIDIDFLKVFLKSPDFIELLKQQVPGGIKTEIKPKHILPLEVYFPEELSEQKNIAYNFFERENKFLKLKDHLSYQLAQIENLNQAILQEAMQGKLVEQNLKDEPASELLKRIKVEKAKSGKKAKPLPPIKSEDIPFKIPNNWTWCRLGEISDLITSGSRDWAKYYSSTGSIFVRMGNLSKNGFKLRLNNIQYVNPPKNSEGKRTSLLENDILVSITGEVGNLGLIPKDFGEAYINQHTALVRINKLSSVRFICYTLLTKFLKDQFNAPQRGMKNSFRLSDIDNLIFPLPPLSEQVRIIDELEKQLAKIEQLKTHIIANRQATEQLLKALLYQAFAVEEVEEEEESLLEVN